MTSPNRSMLLQLARLPPDLQNTFVSLFTSQLTHAHNILADHAAELSNHHNVNLMSITIASFKQTLTSFEREMHQGVQQAIKLSNEQSSVINYSFDRSASLKPSIDADDAVQSVHIIHSPRSSTNHVDKPSEASSNLLPTPLNPALSITGRSPRLLSQRSPMRLQPVREQSWEHSYQVSDDSSSQPISASRNPPIVPPIELPSGSPAVLDAICSAQMSNRSRKYMTAPHDLASMMAEWQASHVQPSAANLSSRATLNETASPACSSSPSSIKSHIDRARSMSRSLSQHASDNSDSDSESDDEPSVSIKSKRSSLISSTSTPDDPHNMFVRGAATMRHEEVRLMMNWMREANKQKSEPKPS